MVALLKGHRIKPLLCFVEREKTFSMKPMQQFQGLMSCYHLLLLPLILLNPKSWLRSSQNRLPTARVAHLWHIYAVLSPHAQTCRFSGFLGSSNHNILGPEAAHSLYSEAPLSPGPGKESPPHQAVSHTDTLHSVQKQRIKDNALVLPGIAFREATGNAWCQFIESHS